MRAIVETGARLHLGFLAVQVEELALADVVVSAGGTMNREAVALGVPVYTMFAGRLGAVDEMLIRDGRLGALASAADVALRKRDGSATRVERDPALLLDVLLTAL